MIGAISIGLPGSGSAPDHAAAADINPDMSGLPTPHDDGLVRLIVRPLDTGALDAASPSEATPVETVGLSDGERSWALEQGAGDLSVVEDELVRRHPDGTREPLATEAVTSIEELDDRFPGASKILATWFASYKGPGETQLTGFNGPENAAELIEEAISDYAAQEAAERAR